MLCFVIQGLHRLESLSFCRESRVEGPMSRVEGNFFSGFVLLLFAVGSISAAQSSPIYMFLPDLVKCPLT